MTDRTVTLSDGSVWRLRDGVWEAPESDSVSLFAPYPLDRDGCRRPLTAADHRAIADAIDGQSARDAIIEECAKVCEFYARNDSGGASSPEDAAYQIARRLRSLKSTPKQESNR